MISQRLRGVKEDGEALEDGFMPKLKQAFGDAGVAIEDSNGELRSTYDILNDLHGVWDTLGSKQKQFLGEKAAGNRQVKVLNAIMANWDVVQDTIDKANDSMGAAEEGNEKFMDSIEGRVTALKSAFQELSIKTINGDLVKGFVSAGTSILTFVNNIGGAVPVVQTLAGALMTLNGVKIGDGFNRFVDVMKMGFTGGGIGGVVTWIGALITAGTILNKIGDYNTSANKLSRNKDNYQSTIGEIDSLQNKLLKVDTQIGELQSKGNLTFVEQQELSRLEAVSAELRTQIDLKKQQADIYKRGQEQNLVDLVNNYEKNSSGNAIADGFNWAKRLVGNSVNGWIGLADLVQTANDSISGKESYDAWKSSFGRKWKEDKLDLGKSDKTLFEEGLSDFYKYSTPANNNIKELQSGLLKAVTDGVYVKQYDELEEAAQKSFDDFYKTNDDQSRLASIGLLKAQQVYASYLNALDGVEENELTRPAFDFVRSMGKDIDSAVAQYQSRYKSDGNYVLSLLGADDFDGVKGLDGVKDKIIDLARAGKLTAQSFADGSGFERFIELCNQGGISAAEAAAHINDIYKAQENVESQSGKYVARTYEPYIPELNEVTSQMFGAEAIDDKLSMYAELQKAMEEVNKTGTVSASLWSDLISKDQDFANVLELTANGYKINTDAYYDYMQAQSENDRVSAFKGLVDAQQRLEEAQRLQEHLYSLGGEALALQVDTSSIQSEVEQWAAVIRQIDAATGALARYKAAKQTQNEDADFQTGQSALKDINEGIETGKVGSDEFSSAIDFMLGEGWEDRTDEDGNKLYKTVDDAFLQAQKIGKKYFGDDEQKNLNNFTKDLMSQGFMDEEGNFLDVNSMTGEAVTIDSIAGSLGTSLDAVKSMIGLINSYSFGDEKIQLPTLITDEDLEEFANITKLEEAADALDQVEQRIEEYKKRKEQIEETLNGENAPEEGSKEYEDLTKELDTINEQSTKLEQVQGTLQDVVNGKLDPESASATGALGMIQELLNAKETLMSEGITIPVTIEDTTGALATILSLAGIDTSGIDWHNTGNNPLAPIDEKLGDGEEPSAPNLVTDKRTGYAPGDGHTNDKFGMDRVQDERVSDTVVSLEEGEVISVKTDEPLEVQSAEGEGQYLPEGWVAGNGETVSVEDFVNSFNDKYLGAGNTGREDGSVGLSELFVPGAKAEGESSTTQYGNNNVQPVIKGEVEVDSSNVQSELSGEQVTIDATVEADTSEVQGELENTEATIDATIDASGVTEQVQSAVPESTDVTITQTVEEVEPVEPEAKEITYKVVLDTTEVDSFNMEDQEANAKYTLDSSEPDGYTLEDENATATYDLNSSAPDGYQPPNKTGTVSYSVDASAVNGWTAPVKRGTIVYDVAGGGVGSHAGGGGRFASGTKNARGGRSLVDEEGAELIEHTKDGTYELGTNKGPRFTVLKKGDVVHTAKETKKILSRLGNVGGFFRKGLNNAKAVIGKAFAKAGVISGSGGTTSFIKKVANVFTGVVNKVTKAISNTYTGVVGKTSNRWNTPVKSSGSGSSTKKSGSSGSSSKASSGGSGGSSGSGSSGGGSRSSGGGGGHSGGGGGGSSSSSKEKEKDPFAEWAKKLFDWAEVRLKRLSDKIELFLAKAENAVSYVTKNKLVNKALSTVNKDIKDTTKARKLYLQQAKKTAKKGNLSSSIVKKIQNGTIQIGEYDEKTQTRIKEYEKWYEKALQCSKALTDLQKQQRELAGQKIDNVIEYYDNRIDRYGDLIKQREAERDLLEDQGKEIVPSNYSDEITYTANQVDLLNAQMIKAKSYLDWAVKKNYIKKGSTDYYNYLSKIQAMATEITKTQSKLIELQDAVNQIDLTNLGWQLDALTSSARNMDDFLDLHKIQKIDESVDAYKELIDNGMEQIKNLEEQNALYREQQKGLDVLSEKYQKLQKSIDDNEHSIMSMKESQEKWNDAVIDLKIDKLKEYQEGLKKTNEQYKRQKQLQDALEELEKARSQRTERVFVEGQGFVYQANQDKIKSAQEKLEDVVENQLLARIDDLVDALEDAKEDNNIYDAQGNLLGKQYVIPQLGTLTDILTGYYNKQSAVTSMEDLKNQIYNQIISGATNSSNISIEFGDINLSEVNDADTLAKVIIDQLPNALLQAIYKKN